MTRYEHLEKEDLIRLLQRRDAQRQPKPLPSTPDPRSNRY